VCGGCVDFVVGRVAQIAAFQIPTVLHSPETFAFIATFYHNRREERAPENQRDLTKLAPQYSGVDGMGRSRSSPLSAQQQSLNGMPVSGRGERELPPGYPTLPL